jgi:hypothetical protein
MHAATVKMLMSFGYSQRAAGVKAREILRNRRARKDRRLPVIAMYIRANV